jgi:hypothetical protein
VKCSLTWFRMRLGFSIIDGKALPVMEESG